MQANWMDWMAMQTPHWNQTIFRSLFIEALSFFLSREGMDGGGQGSVGKMIASETDVGIAGDAFRRKSPIP